MKLIGDRREKTVTKMTHRLCQTPAGMLMQQVKDSTMVGGKMIETNYFEKRENGETGSYLHVLSQLSQPCPHRLYNSLTIHHTRPCIHRIGRLVWTHYQRWEIIMCDRPAERHHSINKRDNTAISTKRHQIRD